jgi:hypothetical protein
MRRALLALALAAAPVFDAAGADGLCQAAETPYFSCQTAAKKWIGVCGAANGDVQYRFGKPGKVELAYPADPAQGKSSLRLAHYMRYQADRVEVTFSNGGNDYAVFDYSEEGKRHAGVRLTTAAGKELEIACRKPVASRLVKLEGVLACDADNALNLGVCR